MDPVGAALTAAGALAAHVSERTRYAARTVLLLLATQRAPEVTIEDTGEISLEWYRDNQHVAVLTVDGQYIRWAAMLDHIPVAGSEFFSSVIPLQALLAVKAADPII